MQIVVKNLLDCQEHISSLAELWYQEISRHWVAGASVDRATANLTKHLNRDIMPLALTALDGSKPTGMACLRETDGIRPGVTPWLGSLVVDPAYRNSGVGQMLIDAVKARANAFGYDTLYLLAFDPTIPNWYAKLGWKHIGYDELFGHRVTVMSILL
jgi:GNAT superfamily N-acetyltransferase